jgi:MFS family permease
MLIVGRAVAGLGGSGITNGSLTIISASVPLEKRPSKSLPGNFAVLELIPASSIPGNYDIV